MRFKNSYIDKIKKIVSEKKLTYKIDTMGCSMNENDSSKYRGILESMGFIKSETEDANLYLFNTCCIRENAENTLFGRLGYVKNKKKQNKDTYIAVVGCMTQQKHILDKIKISYPFTDIVLGTNSMAEFPEKIYNVIVNRKKEYEYIEERAEILEDVPIIFEDKSRASVSIIYGCNNFCSYCIVPYVRGRERSRKKEDILEDIKSLAKKGYKEITLLGQNVNSYGLDFEDQKYRFPQLLKDIETIDGIEIIKFMSPHPKDFSEDLIDVISSSTKISKQIHLPLQSGSNNILKEMNRKYTKEKYLEVVEKLKIKNPEIAFSTDIIIGFPGETEEDFLETLDVVRKVKYNQVFMFIYSKRTGTRSAKMEDLTKESVKVERLQRLKKLHEEIIKELNEEMIGKEYSLIVEGKSKNNDKLYTGRTSQNKVVVFEASDKYIGNIVKIKIINDHLWYLKGIIID